jgi:hypothetical protein
LSEGKTILVLVLPSIKEEEEEETTFRDDPTLTLEDIEITQAKKLVFKRKLNLLEFKLITIDKPPEHH